LAGIKFSGSEKTNGQMARTLKNIDINNRAPKISFHEKYGWNGILSKLRGLPRGLFDPFS